MRIKHNSVKRANGCIKVIPENSDDLWHIYSLIRKGDFVYASTSRKVSGVNGDTYRKLMNLTLKTTKVEYDQDSWNLRISGTVSEGNEHVKNNQYHTFDINCNSHPLTIWKEEWDKVSLFKVAQISKLANLEGVADVTAVLFDERLGLCNIFVVSETLVRKVKKISHGLPKRSQKAHFDNARQKFFTIIVEEATKVLGSSQMKCCIIGSPGFSHMDLKKQMITHIQGVPEIYSELRDNFINLTVPTCFTSTLNVVLNNPDVSKQLKSKIRASQFQALEKFQQLLSRDDERAWYGKNVCMREDVLDCCDAMFLLDSFSRPDDNRFRKIMDNLLGMLKVRGVTLVILPEYHYWAKTLKSLGGICCITYHPMPHLRNLDSEDEEDLEWLYQKD